MPLRTREILLVAPAFDAFTLEQDGLLTEILFEGYYQLNMSNPPRVTNVSTAEEALEKLASRHFDMIIVMSRLGQVGHIELSRALRKADTRIPIYLLLNDNVEVGDHGPAPPGAACGTTTRSSSGTAIPRSSWPWSSSWRTGPMS